MKKLLLLLISTTLIPAETLYVTDFDTFPVGPNEWGNTAEWTSNDPTSGAQAIDSEVLPALLNTASLGFTRPNTTFTSVILNLSYDHLATGVPIVEIDTLIGIEDSTNNRRDDFFLTLYNSSGNRLASIRFDNQSPTAIGTQFGIWRENTNTQFDTQFDFVSGELFNLFASIDLENNTWSADVDGIPLFDEVEFTNLAGPINLGFLAFEWDLTFESTLGYGDNFLLVADLIVRTVPEIPSPQVVHSFDSTGNITLNWETEIGWIDQVQVSTDLVDWDDSLPGSTFDNVTASSTVIFSDPTSNKGPNRYYRVRRTPEP